MIKGKNFHLLPPVAVTDGEVFEDCNIHQLLSNTPICDGVVGLTFRRCFLLNCVLPPDAVTEDCANEGIHIDYCANLHPAWDLHCEAECEHMTSKEDIVVDDVLIDTVYEYSDRRVE